MSNNKFNVGDQVEIIGNTSGHGFKTGDKVTLLTRGGNAYDAKGKNGVCWYVEDADLKAVTSKITNMTAQKQALVEVTDELLKANNQVTTLEAKMALQAHPQHKFMIWNQWEKNGVPGVSNLFQELVDEGKLEVIDDNGTYRTYAKPNSTNMNQRMNNVGFTASKSNTTPTIKIEDNTIQLAPKAPKAPPKRISISKAIDLMKNNKGRFFTVVFTTQDKRERTLNGQYLKDQKQSQLGYILVKENAKIKAGEKNAIRNVNTQTLKSLKIAGEQYVIRK